MSLFSVVEHNDDRYTGSAQENAYAEASDRVDDVDLSFCILFFFILRLQL